VSSADWTTHAISATLGGMEDFPTVDQVTAANLRRLRQARKLSQDELAREARERLELDWTRDHVDSIERGKRRLSVGEVIALAHVLGVTIADFLQADDWVWLTPGLRAKGLPDVCSGVLEQLAEVEDVRDRFVAGALARSPAKKRVYTQAELKAAATLGTSPVLLAVTARRLWGRSLTEERDRRVDEHMQRSEAEGGPELARAGLQALRGHITRELYAELQAWRAKQPSRKAGKSSPGADRPVKR